jgi:3-phenylpropionate/cinnamic acid dioxygenase small subunit
MEAVVASVKFYRATWRHILGDNASQELISFSKFTSVSKTVFSLQTNYTTLVNRIAPEAGTFFVLTPFNSTP